MHNAVSSAAARAAPRRRVSRRRRARAGRRRGAGKSLNPGPPAACGCKIAAPVSKPKTLTLPSAQLSLSRWLQLTGAPRRSTLKVPPRLCFSLPHPLDPAAACLPCGCWFPGLGRPKRGSRTTASRRRLGLAIFWVFCASYSWETPTSSCSPALMTVWLTLCELADVI